MSQQLQTLKIKYEPHDKQWAFHQGRYDYLYRAAFAGTGGGKTICGLGEGLIWSVENEGSVGYVFEPTYKMVRRTLIPTLESPELLGRPLIANPYVKEYRMGDNRIDFVNGSVLWFGSLEDPEMAEGPNIDWIMVDEAQYVRHFDEAWDVILRRLRGSGRSKINRQGAWVTTTPPPLLPGERLYEFFEDPDTRNPKSKVYRWSVHDNKENLPNGYIEELVRSHTGNLARRFIEGKFAPIGAGSFDFDSETHEVKVIDREILRQIVYGVDFGWTNPSCIVAIGLDGDRRAYILDEFYQNRTQQEVLIQEAKSMVEEWGKGKMFCDRIYVSSKCVNWIHEVMVYDAERKENDHAMDATRYALMGVKGRSGKKNWMFG